MTLMKELAKHLSIVSIVRKFVINKINLEKENGALEFSYVMEYFQK